MLYYQGSVCAIAKMGDIARIQYVTAISVEGAQCPSPTMCPLRLITLSGHEALARNTQGAIFVAGSLQPLWPIAPIAATRNQNLFPLARFSIVYVEAGATAA